MIMKQSLLKSLSPQPKKQTQPNNQKNTKQTKKKEKKKKSQQPKITHTDSVCTCFSVK